MIAKKGIILRMIAKKGIILRMTEIISRKQNDYALVALIPIGIKNLTSSTLLNDRHDASIII